MSRADAPRSTDRAMRAAEAAPDPVGLVPAPSGDPVRVLFGPLREGSPVSTHWRLEAIYALRAGAIPVVMSSRSGERFALEIFRRDPNTAPPLASAGSMALHLVNDGRGGTPTREVAGLGVMALGRELEARLAEGAPVPRGLATHDERVAHQPDGTFDVPLRG